MRAEWKPRGALGVACNRFQPNRPRQEGYDQLALCVAMQNVWREKSQAVASTRSAPRLSFARKYTSSEDLRVLLSSRATAVCCWLSFAVLIGVRTLCPPLCYVLVLELISLLASFFRGPQELQEPSKKLAARLKRFFSTKKDRLGDIVPRFVVVDGMER